MNIKRHIINSQTPIKEALARLNDLSGDAMTLLLTDDDGRMQATLTDGDVRRALIAGHSLSDPVSVAGNRNYGSITKGNADVPRLKSLKEKGIRLMPILDDSGRVIDAIDLEKIHNLLPVSALIMAGGKGERLRPMTLTTPKPLLAIGGKAIIDYNVEALAAVGVDDITVSVNYLAEQLEQHFSKLVAGVDVKCVRETMPLGTIGALSLVSCDIANDTVLVMNSDLLTDISFEDMYIHHTSLGADVTVAAIPYSLSVPFAILSTEGRRITALEEKPVYSYYANAGIYMLSRRAVDLVVPGKRMDATDLIECAIAAGLNVVYFPLNGTWIDVGTPADFRHAEDIMKYHLGK